MRLTTDDVLRVRQHNCLLRADKFEDLGAVAGLGLQDSAPLSALLSMHARLTDVRPDAWRDPSLVQVWGPRGAIYVVPRADRALFTLGAIPRADSTRRELDAVAEPLLQYLDTAVAGDPIPDDVIRTDRLGRLAASATGRVSVVWDGRTITYRVEDHLDVELEDARIGLARRYLEIYAPATEQHFARWAGVTVSDARASFAALPRDVESVSMGDETRLVLQTRLDAFATATTTSGIRLLPPGDPYLGGPDRQLIAPTPQMQAAVWPQSVPPGALLMDGRVVGTWRRRGGRVSLDLFEALDAQAFAAVEQEVATMPLLGTPSLEVRPPQP